MDTNDLAAKMLYSMEPLRKPVLQEIVTALCLPQNSRGLDVGCGIGLHTVLLAEAAGPLAHITGLDLSPSLLGFASELASQTGLAQRVSYQQGSWNQIPYDPNTFDWVWSVDGAGYAPDGPVAIVREMVRVIRPGGMLILGYWSSQCLLPGYPGLEARLNASPAGILPFTLESQPGAHFMNTLGWMREAGLVDTRAHTFVRTVHAPLDPCEMAALAELFKMRWGTAENDLPPQDWQEYLRLCRPDSEDFILNHPAYYAFFTYSIFSGMVPEKEKSHASEGL